MSKKYSNTDFRFTISHKHQNSIRSDICNYKPNIVSEALERGHTCHCNLYSQFINHDVGHVITGDVNIVANKRLRKLFKKGFSFVEPIFKNKSEIFSSLKCDIYKYASKLSAKFSINLKYFDEWKLMVLDKIKHAIYNTRIYNKRNLPILKSEINDLNTLKEHFIMSGVDKANNNISFTCKKYYLDNIEHKLNNTSTIHI